ncbi:hypothetical protein D3C81_1647260 [compost metagenome]
MKCLTANGCCHGIVCYAGTGPSQVFYRHIEQVAQKITVFLVAWTVCVGPVGVVPLDVEMGEPVFFEPPIDLRYSTKLIACRHHDWGHVKTMGASQVDLLQPQIDVLAIGALYGAAAEVDRGADEAITPLLQEWDV